MSLTDEEISEVLNAAGADPAVIVAIVEMSGVIPTGNAVADLRALAAEHDVEIESLLYGLFAEDSPLFNDNTWANLTRPWRDEDDDGW